MTAEPTTAKDSYHHGDLGNALMRAVEEIVVEKGPAGVTLREAARRAGVSHSAPAHHFGDKEGMIDAFCTEGFNLLAEDLMEVFLSVADEPIRTQFTSMGLAYLRFAAKHPAHYEVMMGAMHKPADPVDESPELNQASESAFLPLALLVNRLGEAGVVDPERGRYTATMLWGMCHGIADLWLGGILPHFYEDHSYEELVDAVMRDVTDLFMREPANGG